ncbi:MAG: tetratricopeptide repeat protein [Bacteroidota bacterium]|nr:tetratricopeptide repeat protein [Bacteroidota bacterium]
MKIKLSIFLIFFVSGFYSQHPKSDRPSEEKFLIGKLQKAKTALDSAKALNTLIAFLSSENSEKSFSYQNTALNLYKRNNFPSEKASYFISIADAYWYSGQFKSAMDFYLKALIIGDSLNDKYIIAKSKYNIGWIKVLQLEQYQEVSYLYDALKTFKEIRDTGYIIQLNDALGNYYGQFSNRFKYSKDSSLKYFINSLDLIETSTFKQNAPGCLSNLALFYEREKDYVNAKKYAVLSIETSEKYKDNYNFIYSSTILANVYIKTDSIQKSKNIILKIIPLLNNAIADESRSNVYSMLITIYSKEKNFEKALEYSLKYKSLSDSIKQKTFNDNLLQKETDYKMEKKDKALSELELKNQLQTVKNKNNFYAIIGLSIFGFLILIILYFLFKSNKQKNNSNILLSKQNEIINQKNIEIQQSMQYAKGIQQALLPTEKYITNNLKRLKKK